MMVDNKFHVSKSHLLITAHFRSRTNHTSLHKYLYILYVHIHIFAYIEDTKQNTCHKQSICFIRYSVINIPNPESGYVYSLSLHPPIGISQQERTGLGFLFK